MHRIIMPQQTLARPLELAGTLVLWLMLACWSCTEVKLIGAYDATVDATIQQLSSDVATLFVELEKNQLEGKPAENEYAHFRKRYIDMLGAGKTLQIRTNALPQYQLVSRQVALLNQNLRLLDSLHRTGFAAPGSNPLPVIQLAERNFETTFTAMLQLQNGLKREKVAKPTP